MAKQPVKRKSTSKRGIENCRVIELELGDFAECVQQGPAPCSHALPFGYCFLCMHPRVKDIIENTRKAQRAVKV